MKSLLIGKDGHSVERAFLGTALDGGRGRSEKWLQEMLFQHPDLLPLESVDPAAAGMTPVCTEFALPRAGGNVRVDILGVTPHGRIVLVECKLWRNPEARRDVVGQIFEYASLLHGRTYGDLNGWLKRPLFEAVSKTHPEVLEHHFVDGVNASLSAGDFTLIIAGDGIRSELDTVAEMLNLRSGLLARLAFVEIRSWTAEDGSVLLVPNVLARTEIIKHRVIVSEGGKPLQIQDADVPPDNGDADTIPEADERRVANKTFWQRFIDEVKFDHPDQSKPRHGGNNWVRIPLPDPAGAMTAYRSEGKKQLGFFFSLPGERGAEFTEHLREEKKELAAETGLPITFEQSDGTTYVVAKLKLDSPVVATPEQQLEWLKRSANSLVTALRPRFSQWRHLG